MSKRKNVICEKCKFYDPAESAASKSTTVSEHGLCRRHAPSETRGKSDEVSDWPIVYCDDWCGEWQEGWDHV